MTAAMALLLTGCASPADHSNAVVIASNEMATVPFDNVREYVAQRPVIVTGAVAAVNDAAYEMPVDPAAEGNVEGDGPEIYGTISFRVDTVIKGSVAPGAMLTIVYLSGKYSDAAKKLPRIAYTYSDMALLQTPGARLKTPAEQSGLTFVVFAAPMPSTMPVKAADLYVAGVARVDSGERVVFSAEAPFKAAPGGITLTDVRAAV